MVAVDEGFHVSFKRVIYKRVYTNRCMNEREGKGERGTWGRERKRKRWGVTSDREKEGRKKKKVDKQTGVGGEGKRKGDLERKRE